MDAVLKDIEARKAELKHVEVAHDASKPVIEPGTGVGKWDKDALLKGIEKGVHLKHVETDDKSKPVIAPDAHIGTNSHAKLMEDVTKAALARASRDGEEDK